MLDDPQIEDLADRFLRTSSDLRKVTPAGWNSTEVSTLAVGAMRFALWRGSAQANEDRR